MNECTKCKLFKDVSNFVKDNHRPSGLYAWCRDCVKEQDRERRQRSRADIEVPEKRECNRCHDIKPLTEEHFGRNRTELYGFQYECKPCKRARNKAARAKKQWNEASRWQMMKANGPMDRITYPAIFQRDNGICAVCAEPVDNSLKRPDLMSGSVDHIKPLSRGGTHTFDNVQLTHLMCNYEKGDGGVTWA